MALDHALADCLPPREAALRLYAWDPHTISFGRNEPVAGRYDTRAAAADGLGFVRRPTGGRAVLHAHEVTYAAAVPVRALGSVRETYVRINEGLVEGLCALGVPAEVAREGAVLRPDAGPCFRMPAPGEVVASGRKLVGSAQVRIGRTLLQHGSVILAGDQSALCRLTGLEDEGAPPATIQELLGRTVTFDEVADALAAGLRLALGGRWNQGDYRPTELRQANELEDTRYARDSWTWRR